MTITTMGECYDSEAAFGTGNSAKKMWLGGFVNCLTNISNILSGPEKEEQDAAWEVPFEAIQELAYLGAGAQGVVFAGKLDGEMVAVKKVRDKEETNVKHLRQLNHENIVRFLGVCTEPSYYCLIMEYCQYGSLYEFLHSGSNLLPGRVMKWAKDIALGMAYLHSHKILHRDLKSPNVLISDNLTVKVSDFGTSREWENVSTIMSFTGTVAWMAPEVIRHERCSEKVDVWAFGVVLWEMMTREIPYKNLETHAIMWGVGTDSLSLPIPTGCPGSIQVLMCQCWQRIPKNRPPFKIIAAHLEMATPDIEALDSETFAARQAEWGAEVREGMKKIYAKSEMSTSAGSAPPPVEPPKPREDLRLVKQVYEQQINRANQLYMEVCAVRLQLEQREQALAEREKLLKACRCQRAKSIKMQRQQSSTSSDSKPVTCKQPRKKKEKEPTQMIVNYIDKDEGMTYTVAVQGCQCAENNNYDETDHVEEIDEVEETDHVEKTDLVEKTFKDTVVEQNGNVAIDLAATHKQLSLDNAIPDVAKV